MKEINGKKEVKEVKEAKKIKETKKQQKMCKDNNTKKEKPKPKTEPESKTKSKSNKEKMSNKENKVDSMLSEFKTNLEENLVYDFDADDSIKNSIEWPPDFTNDKNNISNEIIPKQEFDLDLKISTKSKLEPKSKSKSKEKFEGTKQRSKTKTKSKSKSKKIKSDKMLSLNQIDYHIMYNENFKEWVRYFQTEYNSKFCKSLVNYVSDVEGFMYTHNCVYALKQNDLHMYWSRLEMLLDEKKIKNMNMKSLAKLHFAHLELATRP